MIIENNWRQLIESLEKQEIENAAAGIDVPASAYAQMLAIYLNHNDLCNAKYLWKRIPNDIKSSNPELEKIWNVGQKMWQRDFPGIYGALSQQWSPELLELMENIKVCTRERGGKLVSTAYSFISLEALAGMTGLNPEQAQEQSIAAGWQVDPATRFVKPNKPSGPSMHALACEQQLSKLTDFVSFLEN